MTDLLKRQALSFKQFVRSVNILTKLPIVWIILMSIWKNLPVWNNTIHSFLKKFLVANPIFDVNIPGCNDTM